MNCNTFGPIDVLGWSAAIGIALMMALLLVGFGFSLWKICRVR
jgi:hypothetical protein